MKGKPQCKDLPTLPILEFLAKHRGRWCFRYRPESVPGCDTFIEFSIYHAIPADTPEKLVLAKMAGLIRRGLVDGCACGCRGDFEITEKGLAEIERLKGERGEVVVVDPAKVRCRDSRSGFFALAEQLGDRCSAYIGRSPKDWSVAYDGGASVILTEEEFNRIMWIV